MGYNLESLNECFYLITDRNITIRRKILRKNLRRNRKGTSRYVVKRRSQEIKDSEIRKRRDGGKNKERLGALAL